MIVCVKQIADPEAPPGSFKVDEASKQVTPAAGVSQVVSPFDEQAVEAALRIKDAKHDCMENPDEMLKAVTKMISKYSE